MSILLPYLQKVRRQLPKTLCLSFLLLFLNATFAQGPIAGFSYLGSYDGHYYYKSLNTYTWTNAKAMAGSNGGYLASVTTAGENAWIYDKIQVASIPALNPYITGTVWIGLNDAASETHFVWDNGEPVCYLNWDYGEPNNFNTSENHVQMLPWNGKWNDWFNEPSLAIPFIMEIGAPTGPVVSVSQPTCTALGSIQVTAPAPAAGITYSIDGVNYTNTTGLFTDLGTGVYQVTAKQGNCVGLATTVSLTAPVVPSLPTATPTQPTCSTASGTITVNSPTGAGMNYTVSKMGYTSSNTTGIFPGLAPGTYSVTATLGSCTSAALSVIINEVPAAGALSASPNVLWPPNHKMVLVTIGSTCGNSRCIVTGVTVNEEDNTIGDGNTINDWKLVPGTNTVLLRAERKGPGIGRIYTVHTTCGDVRVTVPHDQKGKSLSVGNTQISEAGIFNVQVLQNPATNHFKLIIASGSQEAVNVRVMDINGKLVENKRVAHTNSVIQIGDQYRPGIYLVNIVQGSESKQLKLVKQ